LLCWKSDLRYFFFGLSTFGHLFYFLNLGLFLAKIDLFSV
jgi:hypothetical protein